LLFAPVRAGAFSLGVQSPANLQQNQDSLKVGSKRRTPARA